MIVFLRHELVGHGFLGLVAHLVTGQGSLEHIFGQLQVQVQSTVLEH